MVLTTSTITDIINAGKLKISETFNYIAVGDDDTIADITDTDLYNETFRVARVDVDTTSFTDEVIITGEIGFGDNNSNTIAEVGWFVEGGTTTELKSRDVLLNSILKTSDISVVLPKNIKFIVEEV
jgi:hypothetical protein